MNKTDWIVFIGATLVLLMLTAWCVLSLPNAIDQAFSIGEYGNCVKCHDGERRCYFQE